MKKPNRFQVRLSPIFAAALLIHFTASSASAVPYYWDNDGATAGFGTATGTWAVPTTGDATQGWSTDATGATLPASVTTTTADTLNFGNTATGLATGSITVTDTVDANTMTFASGSGAITLTGGTIALGGTNPRITINKPGQLIGSALTLNANTSIVVGSSGLGMADFNGAIGGTGNLTITTGTAVNGSTGSNTGIDLGGASTYTGTTLITSGKNDNVMNVRAFVDNALPATTVLTLSGGVAGSGSGRQISYDLGGNDQTLAGLTNVTLAGRPQRILNSTGTGTLTINNTSPASSSFGGNINGTGLSLSKTGTGTQILTAGNTLSGTTTISGGKLIGVVGGNTASSKVIIDNTLGTFGISVTDNTKTWTVKELAPTAAGTVEFNFGAITPSTTLSPLTITVPIVFTGVADFTAATPKIQVNVDTGLLPGTYPLMTWDSLSGTAPATADLTVSNVAGGTAASLGVSGNTLNLIITSTAPSVVKANNTNNLNLGTSWVGGVAPDGTKIAKWDNTVTAANTTVLGADVTWSGIAIENPTGSVNINPGNTLTLGAAPIDIDLGTANTADLALNCPLALGDANIWDISATRTVTLAGQVSGAFGIEKLGAGTAILSSGANSYTGATEVTVGTLKLGAADVIPHGTGTGNLAVNGTLDLNGNNETVNGLSGTGIVDNTFAATSPTLTANANNQTSTFSGVLQNTAGTLSLVKIGNGTLTLSGANTFSGTTTVNGGTLILGNAGALSGTSGIILAGGTTLGSNLSAIDLVAPITLGATDTNAKINAPNVAGSGTTTFPLILSGAIGGAGNLIISGIVNGNSYGRVDLNAASNYAGTTLITTPSSTGGSPNSNIFVRLGVDNALPITTVLTLDGGDGEGSSGRFCELNLNGNDQTLAGLSNETGRVSRSQEVYNLDSNPLNTSTLTINNTAPAASTYAGKIGGQFGSGGAAGNNLGLTKSGTGTFTISGGAANTYTGATTITGGTLALGAANTLPDTSAVLIGAGTLSAATTGAEIAGTLDVTGASVINLATGAQLIFAASNGINSGTWAGTLNLTGDFVSGASLNFGSSTGLTAQQLSKISATGFTNFALDAEGDLTATAVSGNTFADWLVTNAPATGFVTDTDKDGLGNGVENVLGSNPNTYNAGLTQVSSTATSVTFKHTLNPTIASDVTYGYEWSTNMVEWKTTGQTNTAGTTATVTASAPVSGVVTVTVTITGGPSARLFGRLAAVN